MSQSTLWVMNQEFNGMVVEEFSNSWSFTPVVMDILFQKYLPERAFHKGKKVSFLSATMFDASLERTLNLELNASPLTQDRILWELALQQVFAIHDQHFVAQCIQTFLSVNYPLTKNYGEHIQKRFNEVADAILSLDEQASAYFMLKGTSVDDSVETWFYGYNEKTGKRETRTLREAEQVVCEFVLIENQKVKGFQNNLDYFEKAR